MKKIIITVIKFYQKYLSPVFSTGSCRFYPTCSVYMIEAIEIHGVIKGAYLGLQRIWRCTPSNPKVGFDPVPKKKSKKN